MSSLVSPCHPRQTKIKFVSCKIYIWTRLIIVLLVVVNCRYETTYTSLKGMRGMCDVTGYEGDLGLRQSDNIIVEYL